MLFISFITFKPLITKFFVHLEKKSNKVEIIKQTELTALMTMTSHQFNSSNRFNN